MPKHNPSRTPTHLAPSCLHSPVSHHHTRYSSLIGAPPVPQYSPSQRASISNPQAGPHLPHQPPRPRPPPLPLPYPPSPHPPTQRRPHLSVNTAAVPKKQKACVRVVDSGPRDATAVTGVACFPHHYYTIWRRILLQHHLMQKVRVMTRMERRLRVMMGRMPRDAQRGVNNRLNSSNNINSKSSRNHSQHQQHQYHNNSNNNKNRGWMKQELRTLS
jgi:hypothetical protein